jgi:4-aminobutyrate---pyruvate transaminase
MSDRDATCIDLPRRQHTLVDLQVRTLIANGNYRRGAALLGFNHLKRLKNEQPLVFEYPSAIDRTVPAVMELTERFAAIAPVKIPPVYFATTASEANDHLIKFMWYGNDFAGEPRRRKMISRRASYHGSTIAGAALGGSNELHESLGIPTGLSVQVSHPSWPNAALPGEDEDAFTNRLAGELEQANLDAGPGTIGAMIAEPVSVSSGMFPPPASYFTRITSVSRIYGVQLFVDEVVTGYTTRDQAPR